MLYDIQDVLQINLPEKHKDMVTAYNTEWDIHNGQGWELKNLIELTNDRKSLFLFKPEISEILFLTKYQFSRFRRSLRCLSYIAEFVR